MLDGTWYNSTLLIVEWGNPHSILNETSGKVISSDIIIYWLVFMGGSLN